MGNQNSGKTTLFNQLTGMNQHVGNFPGVTVDRKDGAIIGQPNTRITDLPGIYSMSPYSSEELVSRDFVLKDKPRAIINIVDATNIERNLYLTMQLLETGIPTVVALNMMDELRGNGGAVDINRMEALLGVPVVPISAAKNEGVEELKNHAVHIARYQEPPLRQDFCGKDDNGGAVHRCLHAVSHLIEDHAQRAGLPVRFAASKIIEGDRLILEQLGLDQNEQELLEHIVRQMEIERGMDRSAAMADMRFAFIEKVCAACVTRPRESKEHLRSQRIDRVLTGRYTAIPMFILIMGLVFFLTFNVVGAWLQELLETGVGALTDLADGALTAAGVNDVIHSLIINGIFEGVGSVLSFLPIIVVMFFFLSMLEDSGYIARVAFFMDKLLRKIGLSGRSIVPMLIGFGCTVPAVMSTRTLPSERDRRMTILLTPFMSCTAKLPIYWFFVAAFFPGRGWLVMVALYALGILSGIAAAALYKNTLFKGEAGAAGAGAAQLPPAQPAQRAPAAVGEVQGLPPAGLLGDSGGHHRGVVPVPLRYPLQPHRGHPAQHPGDDLQLADADHAAPGPGRLARGHVADLRLHGQGERGVRDADALCRRGRRCRDHDHPGRGQHAGVQPALHPLRGRRGLRQAGAGPPLGRGRGRRAVPHRLDRRLPGAARGAGAGTGVIDNKWRWRTPLENGEWG